MSQTVDDKVFAIVRHECGLDADHPITLYTRLGDLGADSLDVIEMVMEMENAFDCTLQETTLPQEGTDSITVRHLRDLLSPEPR